MASNVKPGACLAVPLQEAVTPPLNQPVMVTSISSKVPNAPGPGECLVAKRVASSQCPVYAIMVSRPLSLPSGASTTTPVRMANGDLT